MTEEQLQFELQKFSGRKLTRRLRMMIKSICMKYLADKAPEFSKTNIKRNSNGTFSATINEHTFTAGTL